MILSAQEGVNWVRGRISNPFWRALATKLAVDPATASEIASVLAEALAQGPVYDPRMPWMPPLINDVILPSEFNPEAEEIERVRAAQAKAAAEKGHGVATDGRSTKRLRRPAGKMKKRTTKKYPRLNDEQLYAIRDYAVLKGAMWRRETRAQLERRPISSSRRAN